MASRNHTAASSNGNGDRDSSTISRAPRSPTEYRRPHHSSVKTSPTSLSRNDSFSTRVPNYSRASTPSYRTPDTQHSSSRDDRTYSYPPSKKLGSHTVTNRIPDDIQIRGSGRKSLEDMLLETCAYELKSQSCPTIGGCRNKPVCVVGIRHNLPI